VTAARAPHGRSGGGLARLAEHCDTIGRVTTARRANALLRLEGELGPDLARRLVGALARGGRPLPLAP
jgi:hypothetical protein